VTQELRGLGQEGDAAIVSRPDRGGFERAGRVGIEVAAGRIHVRTGPDAAMAGLPFVLRDEAALGIGREQQD